MIEGLWLVEFQNVQNAGSGVVVFETGRIFGGDSAYYYLGEYSSVHHKFTAKIDVNKHNSSLPNIFHPLTNITILFQEQDISNGFGNTILIGHLQEDTSRQIAVKFTKLAELP
ncbi:GrlR family regulatory protein [Candidatus Sulfurimonas baltica]|uniref:T3SS negative regulator,GrlR n=1 Tax=Candidatus Sulfurimonas baltica TaxID=2740404 RepID=A0A7S7LU22_9BACT|nr:GrlR family regulatory protein [Candidatus Sulfurimonas baltica]QOY51398.1 hypothetical protein HUE88_09740 [Candidatus Sulfurimonas baltica]